MRGGRGKEGLWGIPLNSIPRNSEAKSLLLSKTFSQLSILYTCPIFNKHLHQSWVSSVSVQHGIHHILIKPDYLILAFIIRKLSVCLKWYLWCVGFLPSDTYVKLTLLNSMGQEMSKCKTSTRRGQPNPVYKETFVFQVALFQLSDVTLILSVYNKRSMKRKEMIGWISLGLNSSGEEELRHWTAMKESKGQQVCRWHALLESWARRCSLKSPRRHPATMLHSMGRTISAELRERGFVSGRALWETKKLVGVQQSSRNWSTCFWFEFYFI